MTSALKTHPRWDDRKKFALAAVLSFVVNAGILTGMKWVQQVDPHLSFDFLCFSVLAVPIVAFVLLLYCARVGQAAIALGITAGLICGVPVGLMVGFL